MGKFSKLTVNPRRITEVRAAKVVVLALIVVLASGCLSAVQAAPASRCTVTTCLPPPATPSDSPSASRGASPSPSQFTKIFKENFSTDAKAGTVADVYADSLSSYGDISKYRDKNLSAADGSLVISTTDGTAAAVVLGPTKSRWGQTYGKFTIRFRAVGTGGVAMMLWPTSDVWGDGEIDFPEANFQGSIWVHQHEMNCGENCPEAQDVNTHVTATEWHTASTEWTKGQVLYFLDGVQVAKFTTDVPNNDHRMTVQVDHPGEGKLLIDYVKISKLDKD